MRVHAPTVEPTMEPKDTYLVVHMIGPANNIAVSPDQGESIINEAQPEAIPFPPWKPVNIGLTWPTIADRPIIG